jgi:3-phosphoshikimate 1-carboxyvinyltransferase
MVKTIQPAALSGTIQAPASKSSMQRACAAALLWAGETLIHHPGHSNDDMAALGVIRDLGAEVETVSDDSLRVRSKGVAATSGLEVNCGESGLGLRMFAPIMALSNQVIKVRGEGSLLTRPMDFFDEIFPLLGIKVMSNGGKLPLEIQGPLQPRDITIDGSLSSQFLTGLLLSFAAANAKGVTIKVNNLKSKPYIDLTLDVMKRFGWAVENRNHEEFYFPGSAKQKGKVEYTVEGDWSGGAFLLVAGAVAGPITVKGLDVRSTQADKAILQALRDSGAVIEIKNDIVAGPADLKAFTFDATECPDLFPPLVALAAYCEGTTVIEGVSRLAHKESNRGLTLQDEFGKMGLTIELDGDRMLVHGGGALKGATVHSRHDHRIAMACAVGALQATGPVTIEEAEAINKSYPDFYEHIKQLGGQL